MTEDRGRFVWYDLMTMDPDAAQSFYKELIGWGTEAWDGPMPYTMWTNNKVPWGALPRDRKKRNKPALRHTGSPISIPRMSMRL